MEKDFNDDDQEYSFDKIIFNSLKDFPKDESVHVVNPEGTKKFKAASEAIKKSVHINKTCKVACEMDKIFVNASTATVNGNKIVIKDPETFAKALELASNYEVYPKTDGTVQIDLSFYGMTV